MIEYESSFVDAMNRVGNIIDYVCGDDDAVLIMHCWAWDHLVRMAMAEGYTDPVVGLSREKGDLFEGVSIKLEEGDQYEGVLIVVRESSIQ